jgi:hypothetical protein
MFFFFLSKISSFDLFELFLPGIFSVSLTINHNFEVM